MTHIPVNFDEAVEPQPLPAGRYPLQITAVKEGETGQNSANPGSPQLIFTVGFTGLSLEEQIAPTVRHYVSLPTEGDEPDKFRFKALLLKRFLTAFNIPFASDGIDTDAICYEAPGHEAELDVELSEPDTNGNVYNRLRIPKLRGEADAARKR
jgi:hypothetical protein